MLKAAIIGTGFWAGYQIPAWQELEGVEIAALYNRTLSKAKTVAHRFGIPSVYDNVEQMLQIERPDFVDIITDVNTHAFFTNIAAAQGVNVICQKPMATSLRQAIDMINVCERNQVRFFVHENFRWQAPVRAIKKLLDSGIIGRPFKARVSFCSAFPVFDNQPFLKELEQFIITDIGSHVLDICRFLFGEVNSLFCLTQRVNKHIKGEDVANVLMEMKSGLHCYAEMSYASILETESFPQTLVLIEGEMGTLHLSHNFELKVITNHGTTSSFIQPHIYSWLDKDYAVVHASIVECNRNILNGLQGGDAENTAHDNFKTVQLVWAAYDSAASGTVIHF